MSVPYTKEVVSQAFQILNTTTDPEQRRQCNQFLTEFQRSEQGWKIAEELLYSSDPLSQFFAAQTLYSKLCNDIDDFKSSSSLITFRDNILLLLENPPPSLLPATLNKLALCISIIALHGIYTFWDTAILNLVSYCLKSPNNLAHGCEILENIVTELEETRIKLKQKMQVKAALLQSLPVIVEFITQVLTAPEANAEIKAKVLSMVNAWISLGNSQLLNIEKMQVVLLQCCKDKALWKNAIQCTVKGLEYSRYAKLLENVAYDSAFKEFGNSPLLPFLKALLTHLAGIWPDIAGASNAKKYCKHYGELLFSIGKNFSLIFLKNDEICKVMIELIFKIYQIAGTEEIFFESFEMLDALKEAIKKARECEENIDHLYLIIPQLLDYIRASCMLRFDSIEDLQAIFEDAPSANDEVGKFKHYRMFATDHLRNFFYLLYKRNGTDAEAALNAMAAKYLSAVPTSEQTGNYIKVVETFVHLATSILKVFATTPERPSSFLNDLLGLILKLPAFPPLPQSALTFFKKIGPQMANYAAFSEPCIEYILKAIYETPSVKRLGCKAILSFATHSPKIISSTQLDLLHKFLQSAYSHLTYEEVDSLSRAIGLSVISMPTEQIPAVSERCLSWVVKEVNAVPSPPRTEDLQKLYALFSIMYGHASIFEKSELDGKVLHAALSSTAIGALPSLCNAIKTFGAHPQFSEICTNLVKAFLSTCSESLTGGYFEALANAVLTAYCSTLRNSIFLKILSFSCSCYYRDPFVTKVMGSLIDPVCEKFVKEIHSISEGHAMTVVEHMAEYLSRMLESHEVAVFESKYINSIIEVFANAVANVADPVANKQILLFFEYVVSSRADKYKEKVDSWLPTIMVATIQIIAATTTNISTEVAVLLGGIFERNGEIAKAAVQLGLAQLKFAEVPENVKAIFSRFVTRFYTAIPKVKAIVVELNRLMRALSTPDAFIGFELQLVQSAGKNGN